MMEEKVKLLSKEEIAKIVEECYRDEIGIVPSQRVIEGWVEDIQDLEIDDDERKVREHMRKAFALMKKYYKREENGMVVFNVEDFDVSGYYTCEEAEELGLGEINLGNLKVDQSILSDLVLSVEGGEWKPFEIQWVLAGIKPKNCVELVYGDYGWDVKEPEFRVNEELLDYVVNGLRDQYGVSERVAKELFIKFVLLQEFESFLGSLVEERFGDGVLEGKYLVYCWKNKFSKVKKKLLKLMVKMVDVVRE